VAGDANRSVCAEPRAILPAKKVCDLDTLMAPRDVPHQTGLPERPGRGRLPATVEDGGVENLMKTTRLVLAIMTLFVLDTDGGSR
jgi:hypothetical protein